MTNKNKIKGSTFERDVAEMLNSRIRNSKWKRIPGSGAIGTILKESILMSDVVGEVYGFNRKFRAECKAGYNHSEDKAVKQFTIKKEWLDKIKEESKINLDFPLFFGKLSGARSGVKVFVAMDLEDFAELINNYVDLVKELEKRDAK